MPKRALPVLTVIVIGRNEGPRLESCLDSICKMTAPSGGFELIYVDTDSRDGSCARARAAGATVIVLRPARPTAARARNAGWKLAATPFVFFVDGDTVIHPDFVVRSLSEFADDQVAVVFGRTEELRPKESVFHRALEFDWLKPPPGDAPSCAGVSLMRRQVLEGVGGFDSELMAGEEPELCYRIRARGFRVLRVDIPMARHDLSLTRWSQYWRRMARRGYSVAEVSPRLVTEPHHFYARDAVRNRVWGAVVTLLSVAGVMAAAIWEPWLPLLGAVLASVPVFLGTAWLIRTTSGDCVTLLLYAIHWHGRQIPMLYGQLLYLADKWRGRRRRPIEYKL